MIQMFPMGNNLINYRKLSGIKLTIYDVWTFQIHENCMKQLEAQNKIIDTSIHYETLNTNRPVGIHFWGIPD